MMAVKLAQKSTENFQYHEHDNGLKYERHDYFSPEKDPELSPQSYLIKQLAKVVNPLHFHMQNQFQVFIEGSGQFGKHPINPYVVHYAGAYTGYGPIIAGNHGLHYLTLRCSHDFGAKFLPAQMTHFKKGPKYHFTSASIPLDSLKELQQIAHPMLEDIHVEIKTNLAIRVLKMPPESSYQLEVPELSAGIFLVMMQGSILEGTETLTKNESIFVSHATNHYLIKTKLQSAQILVLQMPFKNQAYLSSTP